MSRTVSFIPSARSVYAKVRLSIAERLISQDSSANTRIPLQYFVAKEEHGDEIERFMLENFFPREPINRACGSEKYTERPYIKSILVPSGVSVAAKEKATGSIVGTALNYTYDRFNIPEVYDFAHITHPGIKKLCQVVNHLQEVYDVFSDPCVKKVLNESLLGVSPAYGNQGLGLKLLTMSEELGKAQGCHLAIGVTMNPITQKMFYNLGYDSVYSVKARELKLKGETVFQPELLSPNVDLKVFVKKLWRVSG